MRGAVADLHTPHPLREHLPPLLRDDDLARRFTSGLDDVLAPLFLTLDNLSTYLDPELAPEDFVGWLAGWAGLTLDANWPLTRRRALVSSAVALHRWRGTQRGLVAHVELYTDAEVDIEDSGGVAWSPTPGGDLPGSPERAITVRVHASDPDAIDRARLDRLVAAAKPAHVSHRVEVLAAEDVADVADDVDDGDEDGEARGS